MNWFLIFLLPLTYAIKTTIFNITIPKCNYSSINNISEECTYNYNIVKK